MKVAKQSLIKQLQPIIVGIVYIIALFTPVLVNSMVSAYTLQSNRAIQMSSSKQADTNVIYKLSFNTNSGGASASTGGMVIDFCSNTPVIGASCTAPTGFNTVFATLALANQSGITGWSVDTTNSTASKIVLTRTASSIATNTAVSIDLGTASNGITNPNTTNTTFYARILTYDTGANAGAYTSTAIGSGVIDAGGVALSTANQITITAKVQETLTFCVYTNANCAGGGNSINLGDTNGVLDPAGPYVDKNSKYDIATNAASGVAIRVKGTTLLSGAFDIAAIGASPASSTSGSEQFGFCTYQTSGSGLTPSFPYNDLNCNDTIISQTAGTGSPGGAGTAKFAFDSTNTNTTYGHQYASKSAGITSTGKIAFIGNISFATEAGTYTTTLTFIATGTY